MRSLSHEVSSDTATCQLPVMASGAASVAVPRALRAKTTCESLDQFVASFARFVDDGSMFVVTAAPLPIGTERQFAFQLADRSVVFQGRGRVIERQPDDEPRFARPGMRLAITELTPPSREVHRLLLAAGKPATYPHPNTVPRDGGESRASSPSLPVPPAGPWEDEPTRPGTPGELAPLLPGDSSSIPLPVNPLAAISEDALLSLVEYTLHEESGELPVESAAAIDAGRARLAATAPPPAARRSSAVIAVAAATLGLFAGYLMWGSRDATRDPTATALPSAKVAPETAAPVTGVLELSSEPAGAVFTVDGVLVGKAPAIVPVRVGRDVAVVAALPDHETWSHRLHIVAARTSVVAELPVAMDAATIAPPDVRKRRSRSD